MENKDTEKDTDTPVNHTNELQSWAELSVYIDSPRFDLLEPSNEQLKIPPFELEPKLPPHTRDAQWRKIGPEDPYRRHTFDVKISNLSLAVTKNMIKNFFKSPPLSITVKSNGVTNNAIVSFKTKEEANSALFLNGMIPHNCHQQTQKLTVAFFTSPTPPLMDLPYPPSTYRPVNSPHFKDNKSAFKRPSDGYAPSSHHHNLNPLPSRSKISQPDVSSINSKIYQKEGTKGHSYKPMTSPTTNETVDSKTRVPLQLAKRTLPMKEVASVPPTRNPSIFGQAKPINDISSLQPNFDHKESSSYGSDSYSQNKLTHESKFGSSRVESPMKSRATGESSEFTKKSDSTPSLAEKPIVNKALPTSQHKQNLESRGAEVKRLLKKDHVTSSSSTPNKVKPNPYGNATPVDVKDISEIRKRASRENDSPVDSNQKVPIDQEKISDSNTQDTKETNDSFLIKPTEFQAEVENQTPDSPSAPSNQDTIPTTPKTPIIESMSLSRNSKTSIPPLSESAPDVTHTTSKIDAIDWNSQKYLHKLQFNHKWTEDSTATSQPTSNLNQPQQPPPLTYDPVKIPDKETNNFNKDFLFKNDTTAFSNSPMTLQRRYTKNRRDGDFRNFNITDTKSSVGSDDLNNFSRNHQIPPKDGKSDQGNELNSYNKKTPKSRNNTTSRKQPTYDTKNNSLNSKPDSISRTNFNEFYNKLDNSRNYSFKSHDFRSRPAQEPMNIRNNYTSESSSHVKTHNRFSVLKTEEAHD